MAKIWDISIAEAQTMRCGNCAVFDITTPMRECIVSGLGGTKRAVDIVERARLGYCHMYRFKCAAARTCASWVYGGPMRDKQ